MRWTLGHASGRVVDVGCASRWIEQALPQGCEYIGLDYPATGRNLYGAHPDVFADAARLPFGDESVDCIVLFEVLEHVAEPRSALAEAARVLRPGGRLLLTMPFMYPMHDEPHDYQRFTRHGLSRETEKAGLTVKHLEGSLTAIETAGLLMCLALGGAAKAYLDRKSPLSVLVPVLGTLILLVNCSAWIAGRLLPNWKALTNNYHLVAEKVTGNGD